MNSKITFGYCTFPDLDSARRICDELVQEGTIACANILGPMHSIYKWKGEVKAEPEFIAIIKTDLKKQAKLKERIQAAHPYENPCLVFLAVQDGLPEFLSWVSAQSS